MVAQANIIETTTSTGKGFVPADAFINFEVTFTTKSGKQFDIPVKTGVSVRWDSIDPNLAAVLKKRLEDGLGEALVPCFTLKAVRFNLATKQSKQADKSTVKQLDSDI